MSTTIELKSQLAIWKKEIDLFIKTGGVTIPKSKFIFDENNLGISFNTLVRPNFDAIENAKKIEFYIKKNLLIAVDIYDLKSKKDDYLPEYLIEEFFVTCDILEKLFLELDN
ncbi:hypothetical protein ACFSX9_01770 [Flavobacterium ardleyense]|uniref:Uncharacterized protein n=1 Tax=Flavobacterium ardleyense TaxID=2038737 RepID=A0ABW5Z424_9FLAO